MPFQALFLAHSPDADKSRHRCLIDTGAYRLHSVIVRNQAEALEVIGDLLKAGPIDSIITCPGFTHADIAGIVAATGGKAAVCPARGDGPSSRIALEALKRAGVI